MIQVLSQSSEQMQNVFTPLPMNAHFIFCLIATLVYFAQYYRKGSLHYLLMLAACDLTFVTQINTSSVVMTALFIVETALIIASIVISFKFSKKNKANEKTTQKPAADAADDAFDD